MAKALNIGDFNQRIEIQEETATRGDSGQEILSWTAVFSCWASINKTASGAGENKAADQLVVTTPSDFTIRHREGITEKMRILFRGSYYSITNIEDLGRSRFMTIETQKVE